MSCCNQRSTGSHAYQAHPATSSNVPATGLPQDPVFEYIGGSSLSVTGPITGRPYRFAASGARQTISRHDAASMLYIPNLRQVALRRG